MGSHEQVSLWQMTLKAAIEELNKGKESATQLQSLLKGMPSSGPAEELLGEVLGSFSKVFSALDLEKIAEAPLDHANLPCSDEQRSGISSFKRKIQAPARRTGCRRRAHPYTSRTVLSKAVKDGYAWRKYGQKNIYGATHPRGYYRCIHKHDRGCLATRQVQKAEDGSNMFAITYMGEHTCMDNQSTPCVISFDQSNITTTDQQGTPLSSTLPQLKQECDEEVLSNHSPRSSSSELLMFQDLSAFEGSAPVAHFMGPAASDQYDVTSAFCSSTSSLDMDFDAETFEFDDVFNFSQDEYFT